MDYISDRYCKLPQYSHLHIVLVKAVSMYKGFDLPQRKLNRKCQRLEACFTSKVQSNLAAPLTISLTAIQGNFKAEISFNVLRVQHAFRKQTFKQ